MRLLREVIAIHQRALQQHRLFQAMEENVSVEPLARLARGAVWLPMVFQDLLRLNADSVRGTEFDRFAEYHRKEDAGHDRWYVDDLRVFGIEVPGLEELFADEFRPIRDACYALVTEVHNDQTGAQRIAFLLALEAAGHVFFEQISAAVDRVCPDLPLRYFARFHLGVEKDHDLFTEATEHSLEEIVLSGAERRECESMVARVAATFDGIFAYYAGRMLEGARNTSQIRELGIHATGNQVINGAR